MAKSPSGECPDCGGEYQRLRQHWSMSDCESADGAKKTYTCSACDEQFEDYKTRRETRGRESFYCSKECKNRGWKNGENRNCANCGAEVYKAGCHLSEMGDYDIDHHFCDKGCEQEWKRSNWVLEDHPNWRGGKHLVDALRKQLRPSWWTVRDEERADECYKCGASECKLDVHHIVPLSAGGTNESWNLMTLCESCHRTAEVYTRQFDAFRPILIE